MARDYQVNFFFCDSDDLFENWTAQQFYDFIKEGLVFDGIEAKNIKATRTHKFKWSENCPENSDYVPAEIFEERFLGME